jgi:hypothetical protein
MVQQKRQQHDNETTCQQNREKNIVDPAPFGGHLQGHATFVEIGKRILFGQLFWPEGFNNV